MIVFTYFWQKLFRMSELVKTQLNDAKASMDKAIDHTDYELGKIRAGKASPAMLDGIMVDYYGTPTPLAQIGNINTPDARTIVVQPWEKSMLNPIEKAIKEADLGINPQNDGVIIRLNVPPLPKSAAATWLKKQRAKQRMVKLPCVTSVRILTRKSGN
jgi:ribosome recycling factor